MPKPIFDTMKDGTSRNIFVPLRGFPNPYLWTVDFYDWDDNIKNHYEFTTSLKAQKMVSKHGGRFEVHQLLMKDTEYDEQRYFKALETEDNVLENETPFVAEGLELPEKKH